MKKYFALLLLTMFIPSSHAQYSVEFWEINRFHVDMVVDESGNLELTETIEVDFSREPHHGIFRNIPIHYRDDLGNNRSIRLKVDSVLDAEGNAWWYEVRPKGEDLIIKAGDPDHYFSEPLTFQIHYHVDRAINFFSTHDEVYWNVTGNEWNVPIKNASLTLHYPKSASLDQLQFQCFTGVFGSIEEACDITPSDHSLTYTAQNTLNPGDGLTIVAGFPPGTIQAPSSFQKVRWFLMDNWPYSLPLFTFCLLFYLWWTRGRNPASKKDTIIPHYEPPEGMTPTEMGTLLDERVDVSDISATIVDMAVRGYLRIEERIEKKFLGTQKSYTLHKLKEFKQDAQLEDHERTILKGIFGNENQKELHALKYKFYKKLPQIKTMLYSKMVKEGYFPSRPDKVRLRYFLIGLFIVLFSLPLTGLIAYFFYNPIPAIIGASVSGLVFMAFANFMPTKTKQGVEAYYHILGLEDYIRTAEKYRLEFQERENRFESLLPYAMTFGLADKWSEAFEGIYKTPPSWFTSNQPNFVSSFSTTALWDGLSELNTKVASNMAAAPRSASSGGSGFSGGGFSGGGFGGGGGGAW